MLPKLHQQARGPGCGYYRPPSLRSPQLHDRQYWPGSNDGGQYTISFCNVTVTHTHPGWNDTVTTQIWLPLDSWNGRFQGLGGGGYSTGFGPIYLAYAVAQGFASASTDGGVPGDAGAVTTVATDLSWALSSDNNVNWFLLENYASKATNDMAEIGKQVTKSYYNKPAEYSYFSGCSGGGRQGLMMAQQFPQAFDGILAAAPAINIESFIPAGYWPTQIMNDNQIYPSPCEIDAFVSAAVDACDGLDGVRDGMISLPDLCNVTAFDLVGQHYTCNGTQHRLSPSGARVVQAAWSGPSSWNAGYPGINKDAPLSTFYIATVCPPSSNNTRHSPGTPLFGNWISYLVAKNPDFVLDQMSEAEFFEFLADSKTEYASILAANDPDMSEFKAQGGKMITWHGLADEAIPLGGLVEYYKKVLDIDPRAHDFFRFFEAPGVNHCYGGPGPVPNGALAQLMEWVEQGIVPHMLHATRGSNGTSRDLCSFPLKQTYIGGDPADAQSFKCVNT